MELEEYTALDEAVAVKVMGWHKGEDDKDYWWIDSHGYEVMHSRDMDMPYAIDTNLWEPTINIEHAFMVANKMIDKQYAFSLSFKGSVKDWDHWTATFGVFVGQGKTAAEAICRAALVAVDDSDSK